MNGKAILKIAASTAALIWLAACNADLRVGELRAGAPSAAALSKGKALALSVVEKHGGRAAWEKKRSIHVRMRDTWKGFVGRLANPWPQAVVAADMSWLRGTYSARVKFREGDLKGTVWGLRNMKTYQVDKNGKTEYSENKDQRFIITALLYLAELPFRLSAEAKRIAYMGTRKFAGKEYQLVMFTWGKDFAPSSEHDQYVLWINAKTGRVDKTFYTVRAIAGFATGCMHYDDYKEVDGVLFPYVQTVTATCDEKDYRRDYLHQLVVQSMRFDDKTITHAKAAIE